MFTARNKSLNVKEIEINTTKIGFYTMHLDPFTTMAESFLWQPFLIVFSVRLAIPLVYLQFLIFNELWLEI